MKSLDEKREKLRKKFIKADFDGIDIIQLSPQKCWDLGWDACAKEYEKENAELRRKLEIAKEALTFYASGWTMGFNKGELLVSVGTDLKFEEVHERARQALKDLESAGE